jgi:ribulose-phosphate 3-epimerase
VEVKISPSLLSSDFSNLEREVRRVTEAGADSIHLDVMDGRFVPNLTFGAPVIKSLRDKTDIPLIAHLMVQEPEYLISDFAQAGSDTIIIHAECHGHLHRMIQQIKESGASAGIALNPATPLNVLEYVLGDIDELLIMTVNPGFGGQEFISTMLPKIRDARVMAEEAGYGLDISVDGGINPDTCKSVVEAGANVLIAGSFVFENGVTEAITELRRRCAGK